MSRHICKHHVDFIPEEWKNCHIRRYSHWYDAPSRPGVYAIIVRKQLIFESLSYRLIVLYVGSTNNIKRRYSTHELFHRLAKYLPTIDFLFKETNNFLPEEIELIKKLRPRYNIQHNG